MNEEVYFYGEKIINNEGGIEHACLKFVSEDSHANFNSHVARMFEDQRLCIFLCWVGEQMQERETPFLIRPETIDAMFYENGDFPLILTLYPNPRMNKNYVYHVGALYYGNNSD